MRPSVPTSHPAFGLAKATAQKPLTPGNVNQVFPSSGVQAAAPVENVGGSLAVITTARPLFSAPPPVLPPRLNPKIRPLTRGGVDRVQHWPPTLEGAGRPPLGLTGCQSHPPPLPRP